MISRLLPFLLTAVAAAATQCAFPKLSLDEDNGNGGQGGEENGDGDGDKGGDGDSRGDGDGDSSTGASNGDGDGDGDSSTGASNGDGDGDGDGGPSTGGDGDGDGAGGTSTGGNGSGGGGGTAPPTLSDELVLHLKMDEAADASVATDSSAAGNDAFVRNGAVPFVEGKFGEAALFSGSSWLEVSDDSSLDGTSALTMSAWVNFSYLDNGYSHGIFAKREAYGLNTSYTLFLWNDGGTATYGNRMYIDIDSEDEPTRFVSQTDFVTNTWYHVAAVFDGSQPESTRLRIYVNGMLDHEGYEPSTQAGRHIESALLIGNLPGGGDIMRGMIDELALWRRVLSADELAWIAQNEF